MPTLTELITIQRAFHKSIWDFLIEELVNELARNIQVPARGFSLKLTPPPGGRGEVLARCCERVLESASFLCGFIRDKEDSTMVPDLRLIDDMTLTSLREERFVKFILSSVS